MGALAACRSTPEDNPSICITTAMGSQTGTWKHFLR